MADSYSSCYAVSIKNEAKVEEVEAYTDCSDSSLLVESIIREPHVLIDEDRSLEVCVPSESSSISPPQDDEINATLPSLCSSNAPTVEGELINQSMEADVDQSMKIHERMRWFDLLNHDRTCGISRACNYFLVSSVAYWLAILDAGAILNKQMASLSSFEDIKSVEFSIPQISWSKTARRKLIRSLESDFELVYVAQSCLSWEVLHYQYRKVEALLCSNFQNGAFYENVVGGFQKFQILLERFMEDERCEGKRYWNYVQRRLTFRSLLQVPQVSGYTEEREDDETKGEAMRATEVLQGIEKCIKAFWMVPGRPPCTKQSKPIDSLATVIRFAEGPNQPSKDGPLPASKKSIEDMPTVKITEETDLKSESSCAICLGEYEVGGEAKEMPCRHRYHSGCIEKWLGIHGSCPVCRCEMPVEEDGDGGSKGSEGESRREQGEIRISIFYVRSNEGGATDDRSLAEDMEID
ncbi:hypothetical protein C3L33_18812, partial [Rhododendron williamsianum]